MIISASRRTDIPAFYADWFMNRIRAGFCQVSNPFHPSQVAQVSLRSEDVEVIVFWTRYPLPLLPHLAELDALRYRYYFQCTLTGYPRLLEPRLPPRQKLLQALWELAGCIGPDRIIWRYDPILLSMATDITFHRRNFAELAEALAGATRRVVISLFDPYRGAMRRLHKLAETGLRVEVVAEITPALADLLCNLAEEAHAHGMEIAACAEPWDLTPYGIASGKCIDDTLIARLFGIDVTHKKDPSQRPACGCVRSKDIGAYNTCRFGCLYCYASHGRLPSPEHHDPLATSLQL